MRPSLKAPFPWFGGKSRVAAKVWAEFGDVDNYVEPFAGSLANILCRPAWHKRKCETVNDLDRYLANFWRALALAPDEVARHADWPVNEADLFARHLWLVNSGRERISSMDADPDFFDAKVAGWWVWGINQWIGSGWCAGTGPHQGVNRQRPHLGNAGQGVNRQLPHLGNAGRGEQIRAYFSALADRLRTVRVCCGDWERVLTDGATSYGETVGVFLDPPYSGDVRAADLYSTDSLTVSDEVRAWAIERGSDPRFRIALCGYEGEHEMPASWSVLEWSSSGAYLAKSGNSNRHRERIWFSPNCLSSSAQMRLRGIL